MADEIKLKTTILPPTKTQIRAVTSQINSALKDVKAKIKFDVDDRALSKFRNSFRQPVNIKVNVEKNAEAAVKSITNSFRTLRNEAGLLRSDIQSLSRDFANLNTTVLKTSGQLKTVADGSKKALSGQRALARGIGLTNNQFQEFGRLSALALKRFSAFSLSTGIVFGFAYALKNAVKEAVEFDRELVKISQVTGTSQQGLRSLTQQIDNLAVSLGLPARGLQDVALVLAQTGRSAREVRTILAGLAKTQLAPTFGEIQNTTEGVISALAQFNLQAEETESILGSINTVAARFPVEADDIVTAIRKTGGVFAAGSRGIETGREALNQFIATFTAIRSTTRESADTIATGLRTIFTRIQRPATIELLKEFGIQLTDSRGKFVGLFEAVNRLSTGLEGLVSGQPDVRIAKIVEELGGFRQVGKTLPLLTEMKKRIDALQVAREGTGSLDKDVLASQDAIARQLIKVRENFNLLIRDIVSSDGFKVFIKQLTDAANAAINLLRALKSVAPLIAALGIIRTFPKVVDFARGFKIGGRDRNSTGSLTGIGSVLTAHSGGRVGGTGRGDKIPALVEPGEFIIPTDSARKMSPEFLEAMRQGKVRGFQDGGFTAEDDAELRRLLAENQKNNPNESPAVKSARAARINDLISRKPSVNPKTQQPANQSTIAPNFKATYIPASPEEVRRATIENLQKALERKFKQLGLSAEQQSRAFASLGNSIKKLENALQFSQKEIEFLAQDLPIGQPSTVATTAEEIISGTERIAQEKAAERARINAQKSARRRNALGPGATTSLEGVLRDAGITPERASFLERNRRRQEGFIGIPRSTTTNTAFTSELVSILRASDTGRRTRVGDRGKTIQLTSADFAENQKPINLPIIAKVEDVEVGPRPSIYDAVDSRQAAIAATSGFSSLVFQSQQTRRQPLDVIGLGNTLVGGQLESQFDALERGRANNRRSQQIGPVEAQIESILTQGGSRKQRTDRNIFARLIAQNTNFGDKLTLTQLKQFARQARQQTLNQGLVGPIESSGIIEPFFGPGGSLDSRGNRPRFAGFGRRNLPTFSRAFSGFGGIRQNLAGRGGLLAAGGIALSSQLIDQNTAGGAALSSGLTGGLAGAGIGSIFGPIGAGIGAVIGSLTASVSAFNEKVESDALEKFNKALVTASSNLEKNLAKLDVEAIGNDIQRVLLANQSLTNEQRRIATSPSGGIGNFISSAFSEVANNPTSLLLGPADTIRQTFREFSGAGGGGPRLRGGLFEEIRKFEESFFDVNADKTTENNLIKQSSEQNKELGEISRNIIRELIDRGVKIENIDRRILAGAVSDTTDSSRRRAQGIDFGVAFNEDVRQSIEEIAEPLAKEKRIRDSLNKSVNITNNTINTLTNDLSALDAQLNLNRENIQRFGVTIADSFAILSGNIGVSTRTTNPFDNFRGLSQGGVSSAVSNLGNILPGLNANGFSKALNDLKTLEVELPNLIAKAGAISSADPEVNRLLNLEGNVRGLGLSAPITNAIIGKLEEELNRTTPGQRRSFEDFAQTLDVESLTGELRSKLIGVFQQSQEQLNSITQEYVNNLNNQLQAQLAINSRRLTAEQIVANTSLEIARLQGKELSLRELNAQPEREIRSSNIFGTLSPNLIGLEIRDLLEQRSGIQNRLDRDPNNIGLVNELARNTEALSEAQRSLELVANSSQLLANIQSRIQQQQQKEQFAKASIEELLFGGPEAQLEFRRRTQLAGRALGGDTRGITGQDLRGVIDVLRFAGTSANLGLVNGQAAGTLPPQQIEAIIGNILGPLAANILPGFNQEQLTNLLSGSPTVTVENLITEFKSVSDRQVSAIQEQASIQQQILDAVKVQNGEQLTLAIEGLNNTLSSDLAGKIADTFNNSELIRINSELVAKAQGLTDSIDNLAEGIGNPIARNRGGLIPGRGPNRDSIPAYLTKGEFIVNRDATDQNLDLLMAINNGYVNGGRLRKLSPAEILQSRKDRRTKEIARRQKSREKFAALRLVNNPINKEIARSRTAEAFNIEQPALNPYDMFKQNRGTINGRNTEDVIAEIRKRRTGFNSGGQVGNNTSRRNSGSGMSVAMKQFSEASSQLIKSINPFVTAINSLSESLQKTNIPSKIEMSGNHRLIVEVNGINSLEPMIKQWIGQEINKSLSKVMNLQTGETKEGVVLG